MSDNKDAEGHEAHRWELLPIDEFASVAKDWDEINREYSDSPLLDHDFIRICLEHFGDGSEVVASCHQGGQMVAAAVLARNSKLAWQSFQAQQAPMGAWIQRPGQSLEALLASLCAALPRPAPLVAVTQLDPDFLRRPQAAGLVDTLDYIQTSKITIEGSFEQYWQARGKNLKQNLRRQRNRLTREEVSTRLEVVTDGADSAKLVDDYGELESAGWKREAGTAVHPDNAQGRFYRDLMQHYFARDEAVIYRYHYNDKLVSTDLCLRRSGVLILLKTTYDETQKTTSPTMLMRYELFEEIFASKIFERIEFYGPVMGWHRKWTDEIRTMYHVNRYGSQLVKGLVSFRNRARQALARVGLAKREKRDH